MDASRTAPIEARRSRRPAGARTLLAWRGVGLVLGVAAAVLYAAGGSAALLGQPVAGGTAQLFTGTATVFALVAGTALWWVWRNPGWPRTARTELADALVSAFLLFSAVRVVLRLLAEAAVLTPPAPIRPALLVAAALCFVAGLAVAVREHPAGRR